MGCNCGNKGNTAPKSFVVTDPKTKTNKSYRTEVEAIAAAKRVGGTYRPA
jgi:hypothetical protein